LIEAFHELTEEDLNIPAPRASELPRVHMPAYCEVALPVPLDRTFTYAVREGQLPQRGRG
jgi:hypothetical protein